MKLENRKKFKLISSMGFTLMEVMLSVSILSMGIVGSYGLITSSMAKFSTATNRIIASNLAQDGLERVRNVRDTNWLQDRTSPTGSGPSSWDYRINGQGAEKLAKFSCVAGTFTTDNISGGATEEQKIDNCGTNCQVYTETSGSAKCFSDTGGAIYPNFYRMIHIDNIDTHSNIVKVTIKWVDRTGVHYITIEEILYNWKET